MVKKPKVTPQADVHEATDFERAVSCLEAAFTYLGIPLADEHFVDTPKRFARYLQEYLTPFNPDDVLKTGFDSPVVATDAYKGMVVQPNLPFRTICPHHLLPVVGVTHIGYVPDKRILGLSKFGRLVKAVGKSFPQMQETATERLADIIMDRLEPRGVIIVVSAIHNCMAGRGVAIPQVPTTTSVVRGVFRDVPHAREEFFHLIRNSHLIDS